MGGSGLHDVTGMMTVQDQTVFEELNEKRLEQYAALSRTEYQDAPVCSRAHLEWKYLHNPFGRSCGINHYRDGKLVGRISYQQRDFLVDGRRVRGANLVDLLVHPDYRNLGIFLQLAAMPFGGRGIPGIAFGIMLPNPVSLPLYRGLLRLRPIGRLPVSAYPIRFPKLAARALGWSAYPFSAIMEAIYPRAPAGRSLGMRFSTDPPQPADYDAMLGRWAPGRRVWGDRSWSWHRWRFFEDPARRYVVTYHYRGDTLMGYTACRLQTTEGLNAYFVVDVLTTLDQPKLLRAVQQRIIAEATAQSADLAMVIATDLEEPGRSLTRFPFLRVPERVLPTAVELFVLDYHLTAADQTILQDIRNWHVTLADFDIF